MKWGMGLLQDQKTLKFLYSRYIPVTVDTSAKTLIGKYAITSKHVKMNNLVIYTTLRINDQLCWIRCMRSALSAHN